MFTLGNPQTHGTYNASNIYRDGDAVLSVPGIPLHTTLEELENKPHPAFQAALAFGKKVVAALNEAEQAGKLSDMEAVNHISP